MPFLSQQRIRIGVTGLAIVFLLVIAGTALLGVSAQPDGEAIARAEEAAPPEDPLSQIGAAPGKEAEAETPIEPLPIPIDLATEELIVNEIAVPPEAE